MASWKDAPIVADPAQQQGAWQAAPVVEGPRVPAMNAPQMQAEAAAPIPQQQPTDVMPTSRLETPRTFSEGAANLGRQAYGGVEALGAMGTGGIAEVLAGLAGIEQLLLGGDDRLQRATDAIQRVQELRTFQPRTPEGKKILEGLGVFPQGLAHLGQMAGDATFEATGSPTAATIAATAPEAIPAAFGVRTGRPGFAQRRQDISRIDKGARKLGVDLNAPVGPQRQQLLEAGELEAAAGRTDEFGRPIVGERGQSIPDVQRRLQEEAQKARDWKNSLYQQARSGDAFVSLDDAAGLADRLQSVRKDFLTQDMPRVNRLIGEVEQLRTVQKRRDDLIKKGAQPKEIAVTINQLEDWRKKINRHLPNKRSNPDEYAAMQRMLKTHDSFMDDLFNADMISGNPDAIAAWRRAREANRNYRERFSDNKVIRDMVEIQAEPETVRKWIFGASAAGAKSEAAAVVRRIKAELGEDSPEFRALRQDATLDLLEPLLQATPNIAGFVRKFDNAVRGNPSLARDLYGGNLEGLVMMRDLINAHRKRPTVALSEFPGFSRILGVSAFGHDLARKALTVKAASTAATVLARTTTVSPRRRMMGKILGYDPFAPMFGVSSGIGLAASQELADPQTGEEETGIAEELSREFRGRLRGAP